MVIGNSSAKPTLDGVRSRVIPCVAPSTGNAAAEFQDSVSVKQLNMPGGRGPEATSLGTIFIHDHVDFRDGGRRSPVARLLPSVGDARWPNEHGVHVCQALAAREKPSELLQARLGARTSWMNEHHQSWTLFVGLHRATNRPLSWGRSGRTWRVRVLDKVAKPGADRAGPKYKHDCQTPNR